MTGSVELVVEEAPDPVEVTAIEEAIHHEMLTRTGLDRERELAVFVRSEGRLRAGIHGWTWGDCCELHSLWVEPAARGEGLGRALLDAAEEEAARRGCTQVMLFSHEVQHPSLYLGRGYEVVGRVDDYPTGSAAFWFRKPLSPDNAAG